MDLWAAYMDFGAPTSTTHSPTLIENHGYGSFKLIQKLHLKCLDNSLNFSLRAENVDIAIGDWYKAGIHGKYLLSASSVKRALQ